MKIITSLRITNLSERKEIRDSVDQNLLSILIDSNINPILIPNSYGLNKNNKKLIRYLKEIKPNGLLLTGGEDFPKNKLRYKLEKFLFDFFIKNKMPVFGICRGMQMIGVLNKVNLKRTKLKVRKKYSLKKGKYKVSARCYFRWELDNIPKNYEKTFSSHNGSIWGIKHKNLRCEGVMFHPERENSIKLKKYVSKFFNIE